MAKQKRMPTYRRCLQVEALEDRLVLNSGPAPASYLQQVFPYGTSWAEHIHPHLTILINGQEQDVPAGIGLTMVGSQPIHTHDFSGTLHVESPIDYTYTLGDFFTIWGQTVNSQQILSYHADATHVLTMTVNGQPSLAFGDLVLHDGDQIVISLNTVAAPPLPPLSASQAFVAQVYRDLLHREADVGGLAFFSAQISQGTLTRAEVVLIIESSPEYRIDLVEDLYQHFLHRAADPGGLASFTAFLAAGGTIEQAEVMIVSSQEYYLNRGGGIDDGFLDALYHDALGRGIDPGGLAACHALLAAGDTPGQVAALIFSSLEYQEHLIHHYYQVFLRRDADAAGLQDRLNDFAEQARDELILAAIVGSDEYAADSLG
jgi:hypothetical protein